MCFLVPFGPFVAWQVRRVVGGPSYIMMDGDLNFGVVTYPDESLMCPVSQKTDNIKFFIICPSPP